MSKQEENGDMTANLVAYIKEKDAKIAKLEEDLQLAQKRRAKADYVDNRNHPLSPVTEKVEEKKAETPAPHYAGSWQAFCPTCDTKEQAINNGFKDETYCPNCFAKTGSIEATRHYYRCPGCGENAGVRAITDDYYKRYQKALNELKEEMPKLEIKSE